MEYRITVSFIFRIGNACAEENSSAKSLTYCYSHLRCYKKLWYFKTLSTYFEGNNHMLLLSASISTPTNLQNALLTVEPSTECIFSMQVSRWNGKLNLVCTLNSVFGVNTNKLKAKTFTFHRRERKCHLCSYLFTKRLGNTITLSLSERKLGTTGICVFFFLKLHK